MAIPAHYRFLKDLISRCPILNDGEKITFQTIVLIVENDMRLTEAQIAAMRGNVSVSTISNHIARLTAEKFISVDRSKRGSSDAVNGYKIRANIFYKTMLIKEDSIKLLLKGSNSEIRKQLRRKVADLYLSEKVMKNWQGGAVGNVAKVKSRTPKSQKDVADWTTANFASYYCEQFKLYIHHEHKVLTDYQRRDFKKVFLETSKKQVKMLMLHFIKNHEEFSFCKNMLPRVPLFFEYFERIAAHKKQWKPKNTRGKAGKVAKGEEGLSDWDA